MKIDNVFKKSLTTKGTKAQAPFIPLPVIPAKAGIQRQTGVGERVVGMREKISREAAKRKGVIARNEVTKQSRNPIPTPTLPLKGRALAPRLRVKFFLTSDT
ncbi:MAG: hypothetical protein FWC35_03350 [Proteobacteria bacterium]|nr:hypothetical protein [Pseudomonadota bacterium]